MRSRLAEADVWTINDGSTKEAVCVRTNDTGNIVERVAWQRGDTTETLKQAFDRIEDQHVNADGE